MKFPVMKSPLFTRSAAAAAVIAALAASPVFASDFTGAGVSESVPADGGEIPDSVTITNGNSSSGVFLSESGDEVTIRGGSSVSIKTSSIYPAIGSKSDAVWNTSDTSGRTAYPTAGSLDIEVGDGGTIAIQGSSYAQAILWEAPDSADGTDLSLTVNGDKTASSVAVTGGITVSGAGASATLNLLTAASSISGNVLAANGGSLTLNLLDRDLSSDASARQIWRTGSATATGDGSVLRITTDGSFTGILNAQDGGSAYLTLGDGGFWAGTARVSDGGKMYVTLEEGSSWRPDNVYTNYEPVATVIHTSDGASRTDLTPDFTAVIAGDWLGSLSLGGDAISSVTVNDGGVFHGTITQAGTSQSTVVINEGGDWIQGAVLNDQSETDITIAGGLEQGIYLNNQSRAAVKILSSGWWESDATIALDWDTAEDEDSDRNPDFTAEVSGLWKGVLDGSGASKSEVTVNEGGVWRAPEDSSSIVVMLALSASLSTDESETAADYFSNLTKASSVMTLTNGSSADITNNGTWYGLASLNGNSSAEIRIGSTGVWSYYDPEVDTDNGGYVTYFLAEAALPVTESAYLADPDQLVLDVSDEASASVTIDGKVYGAAGVVGTGAKLEMTLGETGLWSYIDPDSVNKDADAAVYTIIDANRVVLAGNGAALTVINNGTIRGMADIRDAGTTADIQIESKGTWTYYEPNDPASGAAALPVLAGVHPLLSIMNGATATLKTDGRVYGEAGIFETGSKLEAVIGSAGVWSWIDPSDTSSSADGDTEQSMHMEPLASVSGDATLDFKNYGRMTGDIMAAGTDSTEDSEGALSSVTGGISGTWDGGLLVLDGTGSVTVNAGGVWTRTSSYPIVPYQELGDMLGTDTLTSGMLLTASAAAAAFTNSTVTVINNGEMTGGAAAYGDGAVLNMTVNGNWDTGTIAGTDAVMPAYAGNNGKLTVNVGETGRMTGNVWAETGGSVTMNVSGVWTGAVKAPVTPEKWSEWIEEINGETSAGDGESDESAALTAAAVTLASIDTGSSSSASSGTVDVTLSGSSAVWNLTESTAVDSLSVGAGTVNFPLVTDASSFTGSTLTVTGNYSGDGGTIVMNTVLEGDGSQTDKLVITGDTSGKTYIKVNNVGGHGQQTADGIRLIEVGGNSAGTFETAGTVRGGAYVYQLGKSGSDWYLTSLYSPEPDPIVTPDTPSDDIRLHRVRPEAASYASNLYAANTLFAIKLSDRLGGSAYADALRDPVKNPRNVWLRTEGGHTRHEMTDSQTTTRGNWGLAQVGGDIASFAVSGTHRVHLGLMAGYAHESTKTGSSAVSYRSKGKVSGYSAGIYGTWVNSEPTGTGPYADTWVAYQRFKNTVDSSDYEVEETYHTKGFTASLEAGYTFALRDWEGPNGVSNAARLRLEGQVIRMGVSGGDHVERSTGTLIQGTGSGNVRSRVGFTLYHLFGNERKGTSVKPYLTLNWYHDTKAFGAVMDGVKDKITGSRNFGEARVGLEARIAKKVSLWGAAGYEMGSNGLRNAEAQLGAKILF